MSKRAASSPSRQPKGKSYSSMPHETAWSEGAAFRSSCSNPEPISSSDPSMWLWTQTAQSLNARHGTGRMGWQSFKLMSSSCNTSSSAFDMTSIMRNLFSTQNTSFPPGRSMRSASAKHVSRSPTNMSTKLSMTTSTLPSEKCLRRAMGSSALSGATNFIDTAELLPRFSIICFPSLTSSTSQNPASLARSRACWLMSSERSVE
mmetsp:Transcript_8120/g.20302  ORF Transcript_8120/g.20302 Transcript_8120/m.20302 type:complete len:204 (-) Transcript_8120:304-915(-)